MLRHDHISDHYELITPPDIFQNLQEEITPLTAVQQGLPSITATGDEMQIATTVMPFQTCRHGAKLHDTRIIHSDLGQ